jgi:predicted phosphodiesterase
MRTLILPDVHLKIAKVKKIIDDEKFDTLISLGDWFDDFNDTPLKNEKTAKFILSLYDKFGENFIWLLGNHDVPYVYPEMKTTYWCSGNTEAKNKVIQKVFSKKLNKNLLKLAHIIKHNDLKPIVLSHAGISIGQFKKSLYSAKTPDVTENDIIERCKKALLNCDIGRYDEFLGAGPARYGYAPIGGVTWLDWNMEFAPVKGLSQIVGHTPVKLPSITDGSTDEYLIEKDVEEMTHVLSADKCYNINLDTHLNYYAILEDNNLIIRKK